MPYADDAGIVSKSPGSLGKMMEVVVKVCTTFGLAVSEAKTQILCLHGCNTPTVEFSVHGAGQVYKQTNTFVGILGGRH